MNSVFAFGLGLPAVVAVWVPARRLARGALAPTVVDALVLAAVPTIVALVRLVAVVRLPVHLCP